MKKDKLFGILILLFCCFGTSRAGTPKAKHVVLIGLDGLSSYNIEKAEMPNIRKLMENGSYTLKKRSVYPTSSIENWASSFMGVPPEIHGYYGNYDYGAKAPMLQQETVNKDGHFPTIFNILREARPKAEIGAIHQWSDLEVFMDTTALNYCEKLPDDDEVVCTKAINYLKEKKPTLFFVYWEEPDAVGHDKGWYTPEYYERIKELDKCVARVIDGIKAAGIWDDTVVIIMADHGGTGRGHSGTSIMELESPFILCGKNIKKGHEIQASMMQYDIAATMAEIFGLNQTEAWRGRPMTEIFTK